MSGKRSSWRALALYACVAAGMAVLCLLLNRQDTPQPAPSTDIAAVAESATAQSREMGQIIWRTALCTVSLLLGAALLAEGLGGSHARRLYSGLACLFFTGYACGPVLQGLGWPVPRAAVETVFLCLTLVAVMLLHSKLCPVSRPLLYGALFFTGVSSMAALFLQQRAWKAMPGAVFLAYLLAASILAAAKHTLYPRLALAGIAAFGATLPMAQPGPVLGGAALVAAIAATACQKAAQSRRQHQKLADAVQLAKERDSYADRLLASQRRQLEAQRAEAEQARRARHDLRHHLTLLRELLQTNIGKALEYIDTLADALPRTEQPVCKNLVADGLLRQYVAAARQMGARTETAVDLPEDLGVSDLDLCVALGNLLENALEALRGQDTNNDRLLRITAGATGKVLAVNIDNTFASRRRTRPRAGGTGIASIRAVADKYRGEFDWRAEGGMYRASIVLKTENR